MCTMNKNWTNQRNKMGKRWEGPFEILAFDKKQKGYHVREMERKYLNESLSELNLTEDELKNFGTK